MRFLLLGVLFVFASINTKAQTRIPLEDVMKHVGDSVIVCGKMDGGRYLESAQGAPTLLNIGGKFPNQVYTIVIYGEFRPLFPANPESTWIGKELCVTGKIELYKDRPQIVVRKAEQVQVQ